MYDRSDLQPGPGPSDHVVATTPGPARHQQPGDPTDATSPNTMIARRTLRLSDHPQDVVRRRSGRPHRGGSRRGGIRRRAVGRRPGRRAGPSARRPPGRVAPAGAGAPMLRHVAGDEASPSIRSIFFSGRVEPRLRRRVPRDRIAHVAPGLVVVPRFSAGGPGVHCRRCPRCARARSCGATCSSSPNRPSAPPGNPAPWPAPCAPRSCCQSRGV